MIANQLNTSYKSIDFHNSKLQTANYLFLNCTHFKKKNILYYPEIKISNIYPITLYDCKMCFQDLAANNTSKPCKEIFEHELKHFHKIEL